MGSKSEEKCGEIATNYGYCWLSSKIIVWFTPSIVVSKDVFFVLSNIHSRPFQKKTLGFVSNRVVWFMGFVAISKQLCFRRGVSCFFLLVQYPTILFIPRHSGSTIAQNTWEANQRVNADKWRLLVIVFANNCLMLFYVFLLWIKMICFF